MSATAVPRGFSFTEQNLLKNKLIPLAGGRDRIFCDRLGVLYLYSYDFSKVICTTQYGYPDL